MDEIRTAALAAVAEHGVSAPAGLDTIRAIKATMVATGCSLSDARDAVAWVKDRPAAATLPAGTIVGAIGSAFFKEENSSDSAHPWTATHITGPITDDHVDELLRADRATILRVGA